MVHSAIQSEKGDVSGLFSLGMKLNVSHGSCVYLDYTIEIRNRTASIRDRLKSRLFSINNGIIEKVVICMDWRSSMRVNITLACTECGERNYITTK